MLKHQPERAVDSLQAVWEHTEREGVTDPGVFPVAPENGAWFEIAASRLIVRGS